MIDVSVLILFFNRPDHLERLWAEVRRAQPARLFLYQDGARGERDLAGIEACRKVVENVDWPCEVHRNYQTKNSGCDPSNYLAQKWAFSLTDKCIIFEDDDIPTQSWFRFCKEMLDRYEHDERVCMIAGFNSEEQTPLVPPEWGEEVTAFPEVPTSDEVNIPPARGARGVSYLFTRNFSIWGWASWRRVIDQWDETYAWLDDEDEVRRLEDYIKRYKLRDDFMAMARAHKASGKAFYETIFCSLMWRRDWLALVPTKNQINNLGVTDDSVHFAGSIKQLPRGYRRIFTMGRHELEFPLVHPAGSEPGEPHEEYVPYRESVYRIMAWGHPWIKVARSFEELLINIRHGQWSYITRAVRNRWRKWTKGQEFH